MPGTQVGPGGQPLCAEEGCSRPVTRGQSGALTTRCAPCIRQRKRDKFQRFLDRLPETRRQRELELAEANRTAKARDLTTTLLTGGDEDAEGWTEGRERPRAEA